MKAAVIVFPGSNCDRDAATALELITGRKPQMVWHGDAALPDVDVIVVPGGFSYGDYLRSGAMAAHSPVMAAVKAEAEKGVRVMGICNGFQVLTEAGMLPGVLMRNRDLKFICRDVLLRVETNASEFTASYSKGQVIRIPVAHHDGNYFAEPAVLDELESQDRVAFRYCDAEGATTEATNPNGSQRNIAGILNARRNVLGMMPHPERLADPLLGGTDGAPMFTALLNAFA